MKTQNLHLFILLGLISCFGWTNIAQAQEYIYFDLAAGDITITASKYTGYRWKTENGTTTKETVTGTHKATNAYYVYQSQDTYPSATESYKTETGNKDGTIVVPTYTDVYVGDSLWADYITNNTNVDLVNRKWETKAPETYRTPTTNFITLNGNAKYNLTIDNLYCNHGTKTDGSIHVVKGYNSAQVNITLKNTSKLVKVFFNRQKDEGTGYLKFWGTEGVDTHTNNGSLTLTVPTTFEDIYSFSLIGSGSDTGSDNVYGPTNRQVAGVYFEGGTIYAGMKNGGVWTGSSSCHCVIGGIGAYGEMYIHGGRLTAVGYTASAVIGGGGGLKGWFGPAKVEITGGTVYAYNFGTYFNASHDAVTYKGVAPGTAIGGGTSGAGGSGYTWTQSGHAEVTITGGRVYAQCIGGPAIGGGSSFKQHGGNLTVTISGDAHVTAVSKKGTINGITYNATAAIAGGNSYDESAIQPGKVNLTVGGTATLITGSIDGGVNKSGKRKGRVVATINGGTVQGQFVLHENFYPTTDVNTFTMTGGTIDNTLLPAVGADENPRLYAPGGAIYSNGAKDVINISGGTITHCSATTGGAIYLGAGTLTLSGGTITGNTATTNGGGVYKLGSMMVSGAPIVKGNTAVGKANNVYIPSTAAEPYILYTNGEMGCGAQIGVTKKEGEHTYSTLSGSVKYTNITKEITVTTSDALPFYPEFTRRKYRSEFVIPQDGLSTAMKGKAIKKMTFHLNTHASASWGSPDFLVYMVEVNYTTFGSAYRTGVATATGDVTTKVNVCPETYVLPDDITGATTHLDFSNTYTYQGGNLFVGILNKNLSEGTNRTGVKFSGIEATGAGVSGTTPNSENDPGCYHRNFLPKVTFTMTDNSTWTFPDDCYTGIGTACTNHFFFDDTQACQVCSQSYNAALSPFTLYFVKNAEGDNSWLRQAPSAVASGASPDYTLSSDGVHVASIHTNTGLAYFASEVLSGKDYAGQTVTLTNDIDLAGHNWEPAGFCAVCGDESMTTFAGTFDGQGHTIYNLNCNYDYKNVGLFGHVTGTVKNVVINGSVTSSGATNLGGIAGQVGSGGAIYNTMASVSLSGGTTMGGLVGNIASGGSLKNSYAHTSATNGLVGSNAGTVENCYVLGTTGLAGSGSVTNCYASTDGTDGDFTAVVSPYVYGTHDNLVGSTPLVQTLNNWVNLQSGTDYAQWGRPHTTVINGDYPILKMNDQEAVAANSGSPYIMQYGAINDFISDYNTGSGTDAIYLYKSVDDVNSNYGSSAELYIDEDVALTQSSSKADGDLTATVGVTLKNTQPSDASSWDWHMFSPALTAAPLGVEYPNNDRVLYGDDPIFTFVNTGYFPTITAANYGQIDYYCYFEPEYHWINLKRNGNSHWHEDAPDGVHEHIDYKATPTATVNVNESALVPGKGYLLATKQETLLQCEGVLNNTDVSIAVTTDGDYRTGYNLIGNPYQSYYDFNVFASDNGSLWGGTSNASYILLSGDSYTPYVYNASNNELEAPRWLHPHQGFMIVASNSGTASFYNSKRITEGYSEFRDERPNYALVNLIATDEDGKRDFTTVELGRPDRGGALKAYDLHLGKGCIYTHYEDEDYSIAFTQPGLAEVGIRFEADEEATFTMTWGTQNGDFDYLHLKDNITGTDIDCLTTEEYRFTATPDDYKSRFRLMFGYTGIEEPEVPEPVEGPTSFAFQMGSQLVVNGEGYLEMIDMLGRIVRTETLHGSQSMVSMPHGTTGVYVLRLTSKGVTRVQKIVVN